MFSRNIDFFRIEPNDFNLEEHLQQIFDRRQANPATEGIMEIENPAATVFLYRLDSTTRYCEGMIVKQRTEDVPKKGNFSRNLIEDFNLEPFSGFAEMTYFLYLPRIRVLALLAGKSGVKCGTFANYLYEQTGTSIDMLVLLTQDAQERIRNWHNITKVQWKVKIGNGFDLNSPLVQNRSVNQMLRREERSHVTLIQEYSNPRRSGSLPEGSVRNFINNLLTNRRHDPHVEVKSINVKGSENVNEDEITLDLLRNKYKMDITLNNGTSLDYEECQTRVKRLILQHETELDGLIGDI